MLTSPERDHLINHLAFLSSSSHGYLNHYWLVAYTCLQKGTRSTGLGLHRYMVDYKYLSFSVFLLGQSKQRGYSTWAGGPVKETVSGWPPASSKSKKNPFFVLKKKKKRS